MQIQPMEQYFQISAARYILVEGTKTAAVLPHCWEYTEECVAGWSTCGSTLQLELQQNLEMPNRKKTVVEVLPVVGLSAESAFLLLWAMYQVTQLLISGGLG